MHSKAETKRENLRILLKNFVESRDDVIIALIYSNDLLLLAKYGKIEGTTQIEKETEDIYGAFTAIVENLLDKISSEYKSGRYGSCSFETDDNRIIYLEAGFKAILLLVCDYKTNLSKLFPIAFLVVEKIAQLFEDSFDFKYDSLEIPDLSIPEKFSLGLDKFSIQESIPIVDGVKTTHKFTKEKQIEIVFKFIILGSGGVGTTTLVNRFLKKENIVDYRPKMGIDLSTQHYEVQGYKDDIIKFLIFDLASKSSFKLVRRQYFKGANCVFIVYDVTRRDTFEEAIDFWFSDAKKELGNIPFVLIGNKIDKENEREVTKEEGLTKAKEIKSFFLETSALQYINVQDMLKIIGIGLFFKHFEVNDIRNPSK